MVSYAFGEQALNEIYEPGKEIVLAGNFKPIKCEIRKVEGGYYIDEVSGRLFLEDRMPIGAILDFQ